MLLNHILQFYSRFFDEGKIEPFEMLFILIVFIFILLKNLLTKNVLSVEVEFTRIISFGR